MRFKTPDGSWVDTAGGGILYFSCDRFIADIVVNGACFLCGSKRSEVSFNDEHVLPKWLLKKHNLFGQSINLPNLTGYRYGEYKTPCCTPCNSFLGRTIEQPMQQALSGGYATLIEHMKKHGTDMLYRWLSLIFLKTHLKDLTLAGDRTGKVPGKIGEIYQWEQLHHVHCIVRSSLTGAQLEPTAYGSMFVVPIASDGFVGGYFDFADNHPGCVVALGTGDIGVVAVMDDSSAVASMLHADFSTINQPISPLQLRELYAHAAYCNIWLDPRPRNKTSIDWTSGALTISADRPPRPTLGPAPQEGFGELLEFACRDFIAKGVHPEGRTPAEVSALTRAGRYRFLFNDQHQFISPTPPVGTRHPATSD